MDALAMSVDKVVSVSVRRKTLRYRIALRQRNFHELEPQPKLIVKPQTCHVELDKVLLPLSFVQLTLKKKTLKSKIKLLSKYADNSFQLIFKHCIDYKMLLVRLQEEMLTVSHRIGVYLETAYEHEGEEYCDGFFQYFADKLNAVTSRTVSIMNTKHCPLKNGKFIFQFGIDILHLTLSDVQRSLRDTMVSTAMRERNRRV